jgi:hypothetical protein
MTENTTEAQDSSATISPTLVSVRILTPVELDGISYKSGVHADLPAELAAALVESGQADDNAEAVAYALSQTN